MKMIEILEKDKENLLTELASAKAAEKAVRVLENELDKLLLTYNEQCESDRERNAAANLLQAVRLSLPLIDSTGETKVWETETERGSKGKLNPLLFLFVVAGIILCGFGLMPYFFQFIGTGNEMDLIKPASLILGGLVAIFVGGVLARRIGRIAPKYSKQVEIQTDKDKIYRNFRNAILSVDQSLEEIKAMDRWERRDKAGQIEDHKASPAELNLFSDLLEAAYIQDPDYALEKISEIKYYLHKQQIEVVDYSEKTQHFFDMMPGQSAKTLRPALVADGKLIRKGVASTGA